MRSSRRKLPRRNPQLPDGSIAALLPCPKCKEAVAVGRHKATQTLILHCAKCGTTFPDAAGTKRLVDANVVAGWNIYAKLQAQLELGVPLEQSDFSAAFAAVQETIKRGGVQ